MDLKKFLENLRNLPEAHKKVILFSVVIVLALAMGSLWIVGLKNNAEKIGKSLESVKIPTISFPPMADTNIPPEILNQINKNK